MFQGRHFLKEIDYTPAELNYIIDFAIHLKVLKKQHIPHRYLEGQNIALLFEKTSTRTRAAFTVACNDLGAHPEFLSSNDIQLGLKESAEDTGRVLGSMFDGLEYRGSQQSLVEELAAAAGVPVWNGLTNEWHPTQMMADFMTMKEVFKELKGLNLVYVGDGRNNVANSLLVTASMLGVNVRLACPAALTPEQSVQEIAQGYAEQSGAKIMITDDIQAAVRDAQVIYTDVWVSMGEESQFKDRIELLSPYQVNEALFDLADPDCIFLHCLPAFHDTQTHYGRKIHDEYGLDEMEVTDQVFQSDRAYQFQQAENRLHTIKAIMALTNGHLYVPAIPEYN